MRTEGALPVHADLRAHDHAVAVYDDEDGLAEALAGFLDEGARRGDLAVFVHSFPTDETGRAFLIRAYPPAATLLDRRIFVVRLHTQAFEREGRIDYDHVTTTVETILDLAGDLGRDGARIFVDASRAYFEEGRVGEWFAFERWLGRRLVAATGLVCAYRRADLADPARLAEVLRTHTYRFETPGYEGVK